VATRRWISAFITVLSLSALIILTSRGTAATELLGAGSTFDYPFFVKAFHEYSQTQPELSVSYQSVGSGQGIEQFIAKTVDFGASDVPMNADELKRAGAPVLQIPVALGGEAICYNLPGVATGLKFTRRLVADIYLGKIAKWNDPAIQSLNPDSKLPDIPIIVVHRSDGSGTTYIFSDFLSHVSEEWKARVGAGKTVTWPATGSVGAKGNEGVAAEVRQSPGAIGYVELSFVLQSKMTYGELENQAGKYVKPSILSVAAAAANKAYVVSDTDFSIVDNPGLASYPISGYSWVMVYQRPDDRQRGAQLERVLTWLVTDGQEVAKSVDYVPLPLSVQATAKATINQMDIGK
jgi:phosphate transport system substrate-binding protein